MKSQARGLSEDEKKSIAKYLAQSKIKEYVDTNYSNSCRTLSLLEFQTRIKWTSWGFNSSNTRNQPFPI